MFFRSDFSTRINSFQSFVYLVDIDECMSGVHDCSKQAFCINTDGYYRCVTNCPYPFYENPKYGVCRGINVFS